ncbi:uncharacterized protein LOC120350001 [Nilaparvata lugens]|uniref:uncharacterized protein LOC120350001 n=1 Tax=Nilaparvata lugens TaxID=108931 RepID=UPI00193E9566|nr:uncharacterized protein LOC120350001 [Nilaparvata lugens]
MQINEHGLLFCCLCERRICSRARYKRTAPDKRREFLQTSLLCVFVSSLSKSVEKEELFNQQLSAESTHSPRNDNKPLHCFRSRRMYVVTVSFRLLKNSPHIHINCKIIQCHVLFIFY